MNASPPEPGYLPPEYVLDQIGLQLKFLEGLPHEDLLQIFTSAATHIELYPRQILYAQDKEITHVHLLLEGLMAQARREDEADGGARQVMVREVGPGTLLGSYDFLFDTTYRTRARALEYCRLLSIEISALNRLIYRFPDVRKKLAPLALISRLHTIPVLGDQELVAIGFLADALTSLKLLPDETLYAAGATDDRIFLVDDGQVELRWAAGQTHWLGTGCIFGLLPAGVPTLAAPGSRVMDHSATSRTVTNLFALPYERFRAISGVDPDRQGWQEIVEREKTLRDLPIFANFDDGELHRLAGFVSNYYLPSAHLLIQQGEEADSLWILMPQSRAFVHALDSAGNKMVSTASIGPTYFGETALLGQMAQDSTVEAQAGSRWMRLHWTDFRVYEELEPHDMRARLEVRTMQREVLASEEQRKKYPWLMQGELLVHFSRRHWIAYLRKNLPGFVAFFFFLAFFIFAISITGVQLWLQVVIFILLFFVVLFIIWGTIDYFNDWLVVTNRRVVHQEKVLFINEWRKEAPLEHIQNVNLERTFLGRWLNYGTMVIQTAGTFGMIRFEYTAHFDELDKVIKQQQARRRRHSAAQSKMTIHRVLEGRLGLTLTLPSRVWHGGSARPAPTGWRTQVSKRLTPALRREVGNRIVWRKHWLVLLPRVWWAILVLLLWLALFILPAFGPSLGEPPEWMPATNALQFAFGILTLVSAIRVAWVIADWRNDTYEVSDTELVHVDRVPFGLNEDRKMASLARIQNVEMRIPSPWHWLFNYGNVICQTAAEAGAFIFYGVPDPRTVAAEIQVRMERFRRRTEEEDARKRAQELPDWFEMYSRLDADTSTS